MKAMRPCSGSDLRAQTAVVCQYWGEHHDRGERGEGNSQTQPTVKVDFEKSVLGYIIRSELMVGGR